MALRALSGTDSRTGALRLHDSERLRRYRLYQEFYEGRQFARPRNGRTSLVLNYARTVVDKGVGYLLGRGLGFAVEGAELAERAEALIYGVYWDNDLDAVDLQVAQNAGVLGDGIYKVFFDPLEGRIRVVNVDPFCFFAHWAADDPSALRRVDVAYRVDSDDVVESWTDEELSLAVGERVVRRGPNPYGFIPFVHVPNLQPPNQFWGVSDLVDVIPINRELNERISDQADIIRYHADPPIIFRGVTEHSDLAVGPGTVWDIPVDADVKLLEWQGQPVAVQEHIQQVFRALYEVSETPRSAFGDSGRVLSGVALEMELRPIIQKTLRRRVFWTRALRQRNRLILRLAEQYGVDGARPGDYAPYRSRVIWPPMVPRDDELEVRNNVSLVGAGLRSHRTAMDALGEQSPEDEIARVLEDRARMGVGSWVLGVGGRDANLSPNTQDPTPNPRERSES